MIGAMMANLVTALEGVAADEQALKLMRKRPRVWAGLLQDLRAVASGARGRPVRIVAEGYHDRDLDKPRVLLSFGLEGASVDEMVDLLSALCNHLSQGEDWIKRTDNGFSVGPLPQGAPNV